MTQIYKIGTAAVTNGSTAVEGTDTGWATALVTGGLFTRNGLSVPIESVTDEDTLVLALPWPGPTSTGAYAILRENSAAASVVDLSDRLRQATIALSLHSIHPDFIGTLAEIEAWAEDLTPSDTQMVAARLEEGEPDEYYRWGGTALVGPFPIRGPDGESPTPIPGELANLDDVAITTPADEDALVYDDGTSKWVNRPLGTWVPVSIISGEATIDLADGDRFIIDFDGDCELQVPANPRTKPFAIRVVCDGTGHAFTFASGWLGQAPAVLTGDGDETILSGIILDTSPSVTAVINLVKTLPA